MPVAETECCVSAHIHAAAPMPIEGAGSDFLPIVTAFSSANVSQRSVLEDTGAVSRSDSASDVPMPVDYGSCKPLTPTGAAASPPLSIDGESLHMSRHPSSRDGAAAVVGIPTGDTVCGAPPAGHGWSRLSPLATPFVARGSPLSAAHALPGEPFSDISSKGALGAGMTPASGAVPAEATSAPAPATTPSVRLADNADGGATDHVRQLHGLSPISTSRASFPPAPTTAYGFSAPAPQTHSAQGGRFGSPLPVPTAGAGTMPPPPCPVGTSLSAPAAAYAGWPWWSSQAEATTPADPSAPRSSSCSPSKMCSGQPPEVDSPPAPPDAAEETVDPAGELLSFVPSDQQQHRTVEGFSIPAPTRVLVADSAASFDVVERVCRAALDKAVVRPRDGSSDSSADSEEPPTWTSALEREFLAERYAQVVALDLEGRLLGRDGTISIVTLAMEDTVYLVDVFKLPRWVLEVKDGTPRTAFSELLESPRILKIMFDCRADSNALFFHYGVTLRGVCDLQVAVGECPQYANCRFLTGMQKAFTFLGLFQSREQSIKTRGRDYFLANATEKGEMGGAETPCAWEVRPLPPLLRDYCAVDVRHFFEAYYRCRMHIFVACQFGDIRASYARDVLYDPQSKKNAVVDFR